MQQVSLVSIIAAIQRVREHLLPYPPSSPAIALFKNGELVHFIERHHNNRYVALMDKFLPNWRFSQNELNQLILSYEDWNY